MSIRSECVDSDFGLRSVIGWISAFTIVNNILVLTMPIYMTQTYDRILPSSSIETLIYLSVVAVAALALFGCVETVRQKLSQKLSARYELATLPALLRAAALGHNNCGDLNAPAQKVGVVKRFIGSSAFVGLFDLPFAPLFLAIMFLAHPVLGWLTLGGMIALTLVTWLNQWSARRAMEKSAQAQNRANRYAFEALGRMEDIRAMGMGESMAHRWEGAAYDAALLSEQVSHINAGYYGLVRFVRQTLQMLTLGTGAYLVITHQMSASLIFAASLVSSRALLPVEQMIGGWKQIIEAYKAHRDVETALTSTRIAASKQVELPAPSGLLEACGVTLHLGSSPAAPALLLAVDLIVKPGELVAIIGASGSGKSTLARVLAGAIEVTKGEVRLDGFRLDQWPAALRGSHIGYVGQDTILIEGTVAENIARFDPEASDDRIVAAAKASEAHDFIGTLPDGYNTHVGTNGVRLSGGQVQRLALARALYGEPQVLILDEPNAHLDSNGEETMLRVLQAETAKGRAIVVVTHRANMLQLASRVMIMDRGRLMHFVPKPVSGDAVTPRSTAAVANAAPPVGQNVVDLREAAQA